MERLVIAGIRNQRRRSSVKFHEMVNYAAKMNAISKFTGLIHSDEMRKVVERVGKRVGNVSKKLININILSEEKRFHFDKIMMIAGCWYRSLEEFLPKAPHEENFEKPKRSRWVIAWIVSLTLSVYLTAFLRHSIPWFWHDDSALFWLHDITRAIGGSHYYHLPLLLLWSLHCLLVLGQWWHVQHFDPALLQTVVKPFIVVHYPNKAHLLG